MAIKLFRCCACIDESEESFEKGEIGPIEMIMKSCGGIFTWKELIAHKHKLEDYWVIENPEVYLYQNMEIPSEFDN